MCFGAEAGWVPAAAAALAAAATGAGTYSAAKSNKMQIEAQEDARRQDKFRQAELQRQADADLRAEVTKFEPTTTQQQVDQAAAARTAGVVAPPAVAPPQYQSTTAAAPVEVKADATRRLGNVATNAQAEAQRRAKLAAYGDVSQAQGFDLSRLGERFRQQRANSAGSTNILRADLGVTPSAAAGWNNRSDIANVIGQIGSLYAMGQTGKKPQYGESDAIHAALGYPY